MQNLYPVWGGAEKSMDTLIQHLSTKGHSVDWMCENNQKDVEPKLDIIMKNVDVIVTQLMWIPYATQLAEKYNKKCVVFVRSYENLCRVVFSDPKFHAECKQKCTGCPHKVSPYEAGGLAFRKADLIISNSKWMQSFLMEHHKLKSEVIYPFIDFADYQLVCSRNHKYIAMNQLSYAKGADIFCEIAKALPNYKFKIVGNKGWMPPSFSLPKNVKYSGFQTPEEIYSDVWLWLNPARWEEPFGRTNIEAQVAGIPVISAAYQTAIRDETVKDKVTGHLIKDIRDIRDWRRQIWKVSQDQSKYIKNVEEIDLSRFEVEQNLNRLTALVEGLL